MKFFVMEKKYWRRILLHILVGMVGVLVLLIQPLPLGIYLSTLFNLGFLAYETYEYIVFKDKTFPDLAGWLYGIVLGAIIVWRLI